MYIFIQVRHVYVKEVAHYNKHFFFHLKGQNLLKVKFECWSIIFRIFYRISAIDNYLVCNYLIIIFEKRAQRIDNGNYFE